MKIYFLPVNFFYIIKTSLLINKIKESEKFIKKGYGNLIFTDIL